MSAGIPEGLMLLILTAIGVVAWYGIRRIIDGQDSMNEKLSSIATDVSSMHSRMTGMETWQEQHERQDDERQESTEREHQRIWLQLDKRRA